MDLPLRPIAINRPNANHRCAQISRKLGRVTPVGRDGMFGTPKYRATRSLAKGTSGPQHHHTPIGPIERAENEGPQKPDILPPSPQHMPGATKEHYLQCGGTVVTPRQSAPVTEHHPNPGQEISGKIYRPNERRCSFVILWHVLQHTTPRTAREVVHQLTGGMIPLLPPVSKRQP